LSLLGTWGPQTGAAVVTALAGLGVLLAAALPILPAGPGPDGTLRRLAAVLAAGLGLVLAVALPDFRLLAALGYLPIIGVMALSGSVPEGNSTIWSWPIINMAVLTVAGLSWVAAAVVGHRRDAGACLRCGRVRGRAGPAWATPHGAARWGRWATAVAVAVPVGYAITRLAWALGIPLGASQRLLDELGDGVYIGAGLATLGLGGAVLTLGLVQRWGEVFPRWVPGLRGRRVPVAVAVVPASIVSVVVASAGLMFVRFGVTGKLAESFPGESGDVAAWLPEMFWPVWGVALAAATWAYWLRRRSGCELCGADSAPAEAPAAGGAGRSRD